MEWSWFPRCSSQFIPRGSEMALAANILGCARRQVNKMPSSALTDPDMEAKMTWPWALCAAAPQRRLRMGSMLKKKFKDLTEKEILTLASDSEEDDRHIYGEFAARITLRKPRGPRRQLAVATPPISAPMMPSKAASVPVRYKFSIGVRGASHAFAYFSGVPG
jgi:hypothetical protein